MFSLSDILAIKQLFLKNYENLIIHLQTMALEAHQMIFRPHEVIPHAVSPVDAVVVAPMDIADGASTDAVLLGKEDGLGRVMRRPVRQNQGHLAATVAYSSQAQHHAMVCKLFSRRRTTVLSTRPATRQFISS
jgi:hypothetical protein